MLGDLCVKRPFNSCLVLTLFPTLDSFGVQLLKCYIATRQLPSSIHISYSAYSGGTSANDLPVTHDDWLMVLVSIPYFLFNDTDQWRTNTRMKKHALSDRLFVLEPELYINSYSTIQVNIWFLPAGWNFAGKGQNQFEIVVHYYELHSVCRLTHNKQLQWCPWWRTTQGINE